MALYTTSINNTSTGYEIDNLIDVLKCSFPRILTQWFKKVDLTDALFLRLYYLQIANKKFPDKTKNKTIHTSEFCEELKLLFPQQLGVLVSKDTEISIRNKLQKDKRPLVALIGGIQEVQLVKTLVLYTADKKNYCGNLRVILKKRNPLLENALKEVTPECGDLETLGLLVLKSMPKDIYKEMRNLWYECIDKLIDIPVADQIQVYSVLKEIPSLLKLCWQVQLLLRGRPSIIIGAFEKSPFGTLIYDFVKAQSKGCNIVNVQHGHNLPSPALARVKFDRFFVWDKLTKRTLKISGYQPMSTVRLIGNPVWNQIKDDVVAAGGNPKVQELEKWKDNNPAILVCSQPLFGSVRQEFRDIILSYLEEHQSVKLFIRPHPSEWADLNEEWFFAERSDINKRLRILPNNEYSLAMALSVSDIVTCINSMVLHDALYAGKPVASIDTTEILPQICETFYDSVEICRSKKDAHGYFNKLLDGTIRVKYPTPSNFVVPFVRELNKLNGSLLSKWILNTKYYMAQVVRRDSHRA